MNKFKFYFIVLTASVLFFSCGNNDDEVTIVPPVAYSVQYPIDIAMIKEYLSKHYFEVVNKPGSIEDQDVTIKKIDKGQVSIMSFLDATTYPKLLIRTTKINDVDYELYYLVLRPGVGISPCNVDGVLTSYSGTYLSRSAVTAVPASEVSATFFEEDKYPQSTFNLYDGYIGRLITGWSEIFPLFKTGTSNINDDGTVTHNDFGAGVMFIPSGLAYYSRGAGAIPAYAPLVFSFKLYAIQRLDQDNDGIPSYLEDFNTLLKDDGIKDGYMRNLGTGVANPDDTDGDGIPDFLDVDDDGDNYTTRLETQYVNSLDPSKVVRYYPYDGVLVDDPLTLFVDERQGIPAYSEETPDYTTSTRLRIHLDKVHHTAKP